MSRAWTIISALAFMLIAQPAAGEDDLFATGRTSSAIKPFVFPKSMVVVQLASGKFDTKKGPEDKRLVKKYLVNLDPARVNPTSRGKDFSGPVTWQTSKELGQTHKTDFVFIFRRSLTQESSSPPTIKTEGLIYLTKQNKILKVPSNVQSMDDPEPDYGALNRASLKALGQQARKIIHAYKFEKRRSNY